MTGVEWFLFGELRKCDLCDRVWWHNEQADARVAPRECAECNDETPQILIAHGSGTGYDDDPTELEYV